MTLEISAPCKVNLYVTLHGLVILLLKVWQHIVAEGPRGKGWCSKGKIIIDIMHPNMILGQKWIYAVLHDHTSINTLAETSIFLWRPQQLNIFLSNEQKFGEKHVLSRLNVWWTNRTSCGNTANFFSLYRNSNSFPNGMEKVVLCLGKFWV